LPDNLYLHLMDLPLPTLMNTWTRFIEQWLNESQIAFADYEFFIIKQEFSVRFDELAEGFDTVFNDDVNESEFLESYSSVRSEDVGEELILLHNSYPLNPKPNRNTRKNKTRKSIKPASVRRSNRLNSKILTSTTEKEGRELFEDVIVTDEKIKVVLQLPINNKRENIQVVAYSDNSVSILYLNSEGKQSSSTSALPYSIDIETARSTYRNGILEIVFNRK
jgi:HSP20 family molecular chaperone IbpA